MKTIFSECCGEVSFEGVDAETSMAKEIGRKVRRVIKGYEADKFPRINIMVDGELIDFYHLATGMTVVVEPGESVHEGALLAIDLNALTDDDKKAMRRVAGERRRFIENSEKETKALLDQGYGAGWAWAQGASWDDARVAAGPHDNPDSEFLEQRRDELLNRLGFSGNGVYRDGFTMAVTEFLCASETISE